MSDRVYKFLIAACATLMLIGCAGIGYGLKNKYDAYQSEATKARAKQIVEDVMNSTVKLLIVDVKGTVRGGGTGFVVKVDDQGSWIVTNKHVCLGSASKVVMKESDSVFQFLPIIAVPRRGKPSGSAIIRISQNADLCLVRTELKFKKALPIAKSVKKNQDIFTFGFPGGVAEYNRGKYLSTEGESLGFYSHTDMKIWYGASGSPAVNTDGQVIGVMSNIRFNRAEDKKKPFKREDVAESLFVPLEILREFIGGL